MNDPKTIDVPTVTDEELQETDQARIDKRQTAMTVRDAVSAIERTAPPTDAKPQVTAAQAKIEAVANLTAKAYERASMLTLTPEEIAALQAEFPDDAFKPGAAGKENLIYIEHAFLRDRLNAVIGPGQWALIPRSRWGEDFSYQRQQQGKCTTVQGTRVYVEAMLMVRGCFVAEAVGEMEYYPKNAGANYGDAVEGAKTAALRRCCKEFGIGLQAWKKDWCEGWWARKRNPKQPPPSAPPPQKAPSKPEPKAEIKHATEQTRLWMIEQLSEYRDIAQEYFRAINQLMPNENIEELPLEFVPISKAQLELLKEKISGFQDGDSAERAYPPNPQPVPGKQQKQSNASDDPNDPDSPNAAWRSFAMPFGKDKDTPLAEMDKKTLFGWWANYVVETEYNGRPKKPEAIKADTLFRAILDEAGKHYKFEKP